MASAFVTLTQPEYHLPNISAGSSLSLQRAISGNAKSILNRTEISVRLACQEMLEAQNPDCQRIQIHYYRNASNISSLH
jgi:hypothetical protein